MHIAKCCIQVPEVRDALLKSSAEIELVQIQSQIVAPEDDATPSPPPSPPPTKIRTSEKPIEMQRRSCRTLPGVGVISEATASVSPTGKLLSSLGGK